MNTLELTRRHFFSRASTGLGCAALAQLMSADGVSAAGSHTPGPNGLLKALHHAPKAKRVIYLFMSGGPSQMDLFDYKPLLNEQNGRELPASVRRGQRLTGMSANQATLGFFGVGFKAF